jgi:carboxylesterase
MPSSRWTEWVETALNCFDELAQSGKPVAIIGFSTGATVGLRLATRRPVERLALLAPFLAIRFTPMIPLPPEAYLRWLARLKPDLPRRPPAVRDPEMRKQASMADRYRTFNVPAALSALELIAELKPELPRIHVPTLIIQGRRDTVVEPAFAGWLHQSLGSRDKRIIYLDQSEHLIALDRERDRAIGETLAFLTGDRLPGEESRHQS